MEKSLQLQTDKLPFNSLEEARRQIQEVLAKFAGAIIYLIKDEGETKPSETTSKPEPEPERKPAPKPTISNQLSNAKRSPINQL